MDILTNQLSHIKKDVTLNCNDNRLSIIILECGNVLESIQYFFQKKNLINVYLQFHQMLNQ